MPYSVVYSPVKGGKNWAKVKKGTGQIVSRHQSRAKALASIRAYYATRNQSPCCSLHSLARRNPLAMDPTKTTTLRSRFIADIKRRFTKLRRSITRFLVDLDALGMRPRTLFIGMSEPQPREYEFLTDAAKIAAFNRWLQEQIRLEIVSVPEGTPADQPWTAAYVNSGYRQGMVNAFLSSRAAQMALDLGGGELDVERFLRMAFSQPETMSKVLLLATRSYESLKGISAEAAAKMNIILAKGMVDGVGVVDIARQMVKEIEGLTNRRALTIARTEIIYAHAEGQLDAFERLGVEELGVKAEWSTAGDDRVCPECSSMEGKVFSVEAARGLIPLHPQCRCSWIPFTADAEKALGVV